MKTLNPETFRPGHFLWSFDASVAQATLNRPERKNPLTFESYAELGETFRALNACSVVKAVVLTGTTAESVPFESPKAPAKCKGW